MSKYVTITNTFHDFVSHNSALYNPQFFILFILKVSLRTFEWSLLYSVNKSVGFCWSWFNFSYLASTWVTLGTYGQGWLYKENIQQTFGTHNLRGFQRNAPTTVPSEVSWRLMYDINHIIDSLLGVLRVCTITCLLTGASLCLLHVRDWAKTFAWPRIQVYVNIRASLRRFFFDPTITGSPIANGLTVTSITPGKHRLNWMILDWTRTRSRLNTRQLSHTTVIVITILAV